MTSIPRKTPSQSVPKGMLPTYEAVTGLTDAFCAEHLNTEYRDLARRMAAALCRKRNSPLTSGQPRTWASAIIHVLGQLNFLSDPSFEPVMTMSQVAAGFGVGESTVFAKAKVISAALGTHRMDPQWTLRSLVDFEPVDLDGAGQRVTRRSAHDAQGGPAGCLRQGNDPLHPGRQETGIAVAQGRGGAACGVMLFRSPSSRVRPPRLRPLLRPDS